MRLFSPVFHSIRSVSVPGLLIACQLLSGCGEDSSGPAVDSEAELILQSPKGGEIYDVGDTLSVRWQARGKGLEEIHSVVVQISPDSGENWAFLKNGSVAREDAEWGEYRWKIPAAVTIKGTVFGLAGATRVLIRVQDYVNTADAHKLAVLDKPVSIRD